MLTEKKQFKKALVKTSEAITINSAYSGAFRLQGLLRMRRLEVFKAMKSFNSALRSLDVDPDVSKLHARCKAMKMSLKAMSWAYIIIFIISIQDVLQGDAALSRCEIIVLTAYTGFFIFFLFAKLIRARR